MRFDDIKKKLVRDMDRQLPDVLDAVREGDPQSLPELPDLTEKPARSAKKPLWRNRWLQSAVACALLLVVGLSVIFFPRDNTAACIDVDLGTSCQLYLDQEMNVTKIVSLSQSVDLPQMSLADALKLVSYESYIENDSYCYENSVPCYFFAVADREFNAYIRSQITMFCQERGVKESEVCLLVLSEQSIERAKELNVSCIRYELMQAVMKRNPDYTPRNLLKLGSSELYAILLAEDGQWILSSSEVVLN